MKISGTHEAMMSRQMVLGMEIVYVGRTGLSVDQKLALADAVLGPIKTHINCFGALFLMVRLTKPSTVELSTCIGVGG